MTELAAFLVSFRTALLSVLSYRSIGVEQGVPAKGGPEAPPGPPLLRDFSTSRSLCKVALMASRDQVFSQIQ